MKIKNRWEDLTFNEVFQIQQIISADINETYRASNIIAILSGESVDDIESLPIHKFVQLVPMIEFLKEPPKKIPHKDSYIINGRNYELRANVTDISTAQYVDYQAYMKDENPDLCKITSVFLVPEGHKYNDGYNIEEVWSDVGEMNYVDVDAIAFFLRKQFALYTLSLADSLEKKMKKQKVKKKDRDLIVLPLHNMALSLLSSEFAK